MIDGRTVCVVMPAYNAAKTIRRTWEELPHGLVDRVLVVDDSSGDDTARTVAELGLELHVHEQNLGYGANQKTCYREALRGGEQIVVMVHPDYQYSPRLVAAMAAMIASGEYDVVLGSRILGKGALLGGMPLYKYIANRFLTLLENLLLGHKLSEYHTGFRAFRRELLEQLPLLENSDDFVFDNQMLVQAILAGYRIGEISCPTRYFEEASSIGFGRSVRYGLGVLGTAVLGFLHRHGLATPKFLDPRGRKIEIDHLAEPSQESRATHGSATVRSPQR